MNAEWQAIMIPTNCRSEGAPRAAKRFTSATGRIAANAVKPAGAATNARTLMPTPDRRGASSLMPSALAHSGHHSSWRQPTGTTTRWSVTSERGYAERRRHLTKIVAASHDVRVPGY